MEKGVFITGYTVHTNDSGDNYIRVSLEGMPFTELTKEGKQVGRCRRTSVIMNVSEFQLKIMMARQERDLMPAFPDALIVKQTLPEERTFKGRDGQMHTVDYDWVLRDNASSAKSASGAKAPVPQEVLADSNGDDNEIEDPLEEK